MFVASALFVTSQPSTPHGSYIISMETDEQVSPLIDTIQDGGGRLGFRLKIINGFSAAIPDALISEIISTPGIASIEADGVVSVTAVELLAATLKPTPKGAPSEPTANEPTTTAKPSVILTLADDVGWADVSFTASLSAAGRVPAFTTPALDALAARGVILSDHHAHSTCTPSRAALMTGRYASNTGLTFAMLPGSIAGLPRGMATLPRLLRQAGYRAHQVIPPPERHSDPVSTAVTRALYV